MTYCPAVDGSEIRRSPVEVGSLSHYLRRVLYIPGGWPWDVWTINSSWNRGWGANKDVGPKNGWMNMIGQIAWGSNQFDATYPNWCYICRLSFESLTQAEKVLATLMLWKRDSIAISKFPRNFPWGGQAQLTDFPNKTWLGGGFKYFHPPIWGRWTHFDEHIFQQGWWNHQLVGFT